MATLTGIVTDIETEQPLQDVLVTLMAGLIPPPQSIAALTALTDIEGRYSFADPPHGDWMISFLKRPYFPASFDLALWFTGSPEQQIFDVALARCRFPWLWLILAAVAGMASGWMGKWADEQNQIQEGKLRRR